MKNNILIYFIFYINNIIFFTKSNSASVNKLISLKENMNFIKNINIIKKEDLIKKITIVMNFIKKKDSKKIILIIVIIIFIISIIFIFQNNFIEILIKETDSLIDNYNKKNTNNKIQDNEKLSINLNESLKEFLKNLKKQKIFEKKENLYIYEDFFFIKNSTNNEYECYEDYLSKSEKYLNKEDPDNKSRLQLRKIFNNFFTLINKYNLQNKISKNSKDLINLFKNIPIYKPKHQITYLQEEINSIFFKFKDELNSKNSPFTALQEYHIEFLKFIEDKQILIKIHNIYQYDNCFKTNSNLNNEYKREDFIYKIYLKNQDPNNTKRIEINDIFNKFLIFIENNQLLKGSISPNLMNLIKLFTKIPTYKPIQTI